MYAASAAKVIAQQNVKHVPLTDNIEFYNTFDGDSSMHAPDMCFVQSTNSFTEMVYVWIQIHKEALMYSNGTSHSSTRKNYSISMASTGILGSEKAKS